MSNVVFEDFSAQVIGKIKENANVFLEEAANEIKSAAQRGTPPGEPRLKGSWDYQVDTGSKTAVIGSPIEEALWNEFGTGSHAEGGNGRRGWWVYIEGRGKSGRVSKTYATQEEAQEGADFLRRVKGLPAVVSNGKPPQKTLRNAYASTKGSIERMANSLFGGDMG